MSERWLVCGGRRYADRRTINFELSRLAQKRGRPEVVIHGKATGADQLADDWATRYGIPAIREAVTKEEWKRYGKAAGAIRNQRMLDLHAPTVVIAFPGGPGTADMTQRAERAGLQVIRVKPLENVAF